MGFNDGFCDWQTHASSWDSVSLAFAPIESIEDLVYLRLFYSRPFVGDTKHNEAVFLQGANCDWFSWRRIQVGISNNVGKNLFCPGQICVHLAEWVFHFNLYRPSVLDAFTVL